MLFWKLITSLNIYKEKYNWKKKNETESKNKKWGGGGSKFTDVQCSVMEKTMDKK